MTCTAPNMERLEIEASRITAYDGGGNTTVFRLQAQIGGKWHHVTPRPSGIVYSALRTWFHRGLSGNRRAIKLMVRRASLDWHDLDRAAEAKALMYAAGVPLVVLPHP